MICKNLPDSFSIVSIRTICHCVGYPGLWLDSCLSSSFKVSVGQETKPAIWPAGAVVRSTSARKIGKTSKKKSSGYPKNVDRIAGFPLRVQDYLYRILNIYISIFLVNVRFEKLLFKKIYLNVIGSAAQKMSVS